MLRPNQYVRTRLHGAIRPNAILVPQRAVQQGAKGHFVWVVNKDGKAELRPVVVGDWYGDSWFIAQGLSAGDQVVVDGGAAARAGRSGEGRPPTCRQAGRRREAAPASSAAAERRCVVQFATGKSTLDGEAIAPRSKDSCRR